MILVVFLLELVSWEDSLDDRLIKSNFLDRSIGEHSFLTSTTSITQSKERVLYCVASTSLIKFVHPISFVEVNSPSTALNTVQLSCIEEGQ